MATREQVWVAVLARLGNAVGAVTVSRKLVPFDQVPAESQPAFFLVQSREEHRQKAGLPAILTLKGDIFMYTNSGGNDTVIASTQINGMLDALDAAFAFDDVARGRCTLGGIVQHAWIDGETLIAEGQMGAQAVAIVPFAILVNL
jgi:hypothetical protein